MSTMREAFEARFPGEFAFWVEKWEDGEYMHDSIRDEWELWQAACAAEREACAQIAARTADPKATPYADGYNQAAIDVERSIRGRV